MGEMSNTQWVARSKQAQALDWNTIAAEWVRAVRGKRSQAAFSRHLGYRSSVVHRWESGAAAPSAARWLAICAQQGKDVRAVYADFFLRAPSWLGSHEPTSHEAVAAFLRQLQGKMSLVTLAKASGFSRYAIARWLKAGAEPKLPQFLRLIEAISRRALDFIATLSDPAELPSAREAWSHLERLRQAAYKETWSHAVLRALELSEYAEHGGDATWLASVLGVNNEQCERALRVLETTGQIVQRDGRWIPLPATAVTTGRHPATLGVLTRAWTQVALERMEKRAPAHFGYSLFAVSRADLRRLRDLHLEYLREMQSIIAHSTPNECVGLLCLHLLDLRTGEGNALAAE
jgi:DNA-binding transcriptional regulator YiaG/transcriptional regulator with XRE-family HTH domain